MWLQFLPSCWVCCDDSDITLVNDDQKRVADIDLKGEKKLRNQVAKPKLNCLRPKISPISHFDPAAKDASADGHISTSLGTKLYREARMSDVNTDDLKWLCPITDFLRTSPANLSACVDEVANIWQLGREGSFGCIGAHVTEKQPSFGSLPVDSHPSPDVFEASTQDAGIGMVCRKGLQHGNMNQDNFLFFVTTDESDRKWTIAGVFDGHGQDGHSVSIYAARMFLWCSLKLIELTKGDLDAVTHYLHGVFGLVHASIAHKAKGSFDAEISGTTATLVLLRGEEVVCASAGDSRCIACEKTGRSVRYMELSTDHKPEHVLEEERISQYGGFVLKQKGAMPSRVFSKSNPRVGLAMSRSISDLSLHEFGVTWEPDIERRTLDLSLRNSAFCVIICSDGIWEFMSSQKVADEFIDINERDVQLACESLCEESQRRWIAEEGNLVDDMTAICILL